MSILRCETCGHHVDTDFNLACVSGNPGACGLFEDVEDGPVNPSARDWLGAFIIVGLFIIGCMVTP